MPDYLFLMHNDAAGRSEDWAPYLAGLREAGVFQGGSSLGGGVCAVKSGHAREVTAHLAGYVKVRASSLEHARELLAGNPVFEAGGTVEIRELIQD